MEKSKRVVVIGAGALGLGFLGPEFSREAEVWFFDTEAKAEVIDSLERDRSYHVNMVGHWPRSITVGNIRGLLSTHTMAVKTLADADLCITAVGAGNLGAIVPLLRNAARERHAHGPLVILTAENGHEISRTLHELIGKNENVQIADTVMGRMCLWLPEPGTGQTGLFGHTGSAVVAEEFYGIPYLKNNAFPLLPFSALQACDPERFLFEEHIKLFAHNCVHGMFAFAAALQGKRLISEVRGQVHLHERAWKMLIAELMPALEKHHAAVFERHTYMNYATHLIERIVSPIFADTVERGIRGAKDKLRPDERWASAVRFMQSAGVEPITYMEEYHGIERHVKLVNS